MPDDLQQELDLMAQDKTDVPDVVVVRDGLSAPPGFFHANAAEHQLEAAPESALAAADTPSPKDGSCIAPPPSEMSLARGMREDGLLVQESQRQGANEYECVEPATHETSGRVEAGAETRTEDEPSHAHGHAFDACGRGHFHGVRRGRGRDTGSHGAKFYIQPDGCHGHCHSRVLSPGQGGSGRGFVPGMDMSPARSPKSTPCTWSHVAAILPPAPAAQEKVEDAVGSHLPYRHNARASCPDDSCCRKLPVAAGGIDYLGIRLNTHCSFPGHCVQMKNTFVHINCNDSDSDNDCLVCRITRSASCDIGSLRQRRDESPEARHEIWNRLQ